MAEKDAEKSAALARLAMESAGIGAWEHEPGSAVAWIDAQTAQLFGLDDHGYARVDAVLERVVDTDRAAVREAFASVVAGANEVYDAEFRVIAPDGSVRWLRGVGARRSGPDGEKLYGVNFDVTRERTLMAQLRAARREVETTARELNHRIGNLFSIVSSLVTQSARGATSVALAAETTRERIGALARAHQLTNGLGARDAVDLRTLIEAVLSPYELKEGRITLDGAPVLTSPDSITPLGLVLHELATNAVKYGALAVPDGRLAIRWTARDEALESLTWSESRSGLGPPPAKARVGFGSRLMEMSARQLRASLTRDWRDDGVDVRIAVTAAEAEAPPGR